MLLRIRNLKTPEPLFDNLKLTGNASLRAQHGSWPEITWDETRIRASNVPGNFRSF